MASKGAVKMPVGSTQWIQNERDQAEQFLEQEVDEFGYSVKNELEWLNEHMTDIFASQNVNFADVFKTPGKLRGKTPRTARKQNMVFQRQPLTDIFAPNPPGTSAEQPKRTPFLDRIAHFQIAEDPENVLSPVHQPLGKGSVKKPTDSGYHGDEGEGMDVDHENQGPATQDSGFATQSTQPYTQESQTSQIQPRPQAYLEPTTTPGSFDVDEERATDESFVSAKEASSRPESKAQVHSVQQDTLENDVDVKSDENAVFEDQPAPSQMIEGMQAVSEEQVEPVDEFDDNQYPSETSSPDKVPQRKSSFNFSSLPAREPLAGKRSIGARNSQLQDNIRPLANKSLGKSFGMSHDFDGEDLAEASPVGQVHNKGSTQSLQERIKMLGKPKENRLPSQHAFYPQLPAVETEKDVDVNVDVTALPPAVPPKSSPKEVASIEDEDDDWIPPNKPAQPLAAQSKPLMTTGSHSRPAFHQKSISTTNVPSPSKQQTWNETRQQKAMSMVEPTTPLGSPIGKKDGGPLSASKSRLYSVLRSAKSIFASSASASAAAKLEAHNASPLGRKSPSRPLGNEDNAAGVFSMPGALDPTTQLQYTRILDQERPISPERPKSVTSFKSFLSSPSRKTRSSTESDKKREKERKDKEAAERKLEKERAKEREKAARQAEDREALNNANNQKANEVGAERLDAIGSSKDDKDTQDMPPPPPPKTMLPGGKLKAPGKSIKPTREAGKPAFKPAPVSIRVASQSQRLQPASSQPQNQVQREESVAPQPPPKQFGGATRAASAQGNRGATATGSVNQNARVKALETAARKKEQEERERTRKAEQKRELERKRQVKAEEDRRLEEARKAEDQRKLKEEKEAKAQAQRERERRAQEQREREREEMKRKQEVERRARDAHELASAIERDRAQQQATMENRPRGDVGGTLRQIVSKSTIPIERPSTAQRPPIALNPAKPAKRHFGDEADEGQGNQRPMSAAPPQRPGVMRNPPGYQQDGAKRRRTLEEDDDMAEKNNGPRNSVMAPPKRPSTFRKEPLNKGIQSYSHVPASASHNPNSIYKTTVTAQHQLQHVKPGYSNHPSQFASGRIPFADNANPPGVPPNHYSQSQQGTMMHPGYENTQASNKFKTPARPGPAQVPLTKSAAKSSPMYGNGDAIALPEIATDSEDEEDSETEATGGFRAPSWVASPALRDLLTQQQLVDPESIFGPIGELKMDEVFKGSKNQERLRRLRERGSSAMWVQNGDAVTQEEKKKDREMREKVVREGGWRFTGTE
ncbi:hypothetical protein K431DRAFT_339969 [Polychaeton citri CBS 116435]|uniref:Inner centromere protein ARK-binding domain-containing protein n=1 Tax=Polychaeton citri CBS 116435 TaxID=1314669 RepID=A0A9P4Q4S3_9PEZI|nr:hypothetical protein K431DRAFT_339969 [Polychaeton citri CBS 116435]